MTKKEASLFFKLEEGQEADELWEEKFFEQKQFFLTRPPIPQVFSSRLKKLNKIHEAFLVLSDLEKSQNDEINPNFPEISFSEEVIEAFHHQQKFRMQMKTELLKANSLDLLRGTIQKWLFIEKEYMHKWKLEKSVKSSDVVVSKEPDPMELLESFRDFERQNSVLTFQKIKNDADQLPDMIKNECKRLNLLYDKSYGKQV
jgi:hypothetical protein